MAKSTPSDRIGAYGTSVGAAITIVAVAEEPRIHAIVADSTFDNESELIAQEVDRKTPIRKQFVLFSAAGEADGKD